MVVSIVAFIAAAFLNGVGGRGGWGGSTKADAKQHSKTCHEVKGIEPQNMPGWCGFCYITGTSSGTTWNYCLCPDM